VRQCLPIALHVHATRQKRPTETVHHGHRRAQIPTPLRRLRRQQRRVPRPQRHRESRGQMPALLHVADDHEIHAMSLNGFVLYQEKL